MFYVITYLLLTTAISFANPPSAKTNISKKQPLPFTFRTVASPLISYASLKFLNQQTNLNVSAEKMLLEEAITTGITQTGLSNFTAKKIAHCSAAVIKKIYEDPRGITKKYSTSGYAKTAGKTFLRELLLDDLHELLLDKVPFLFNTENKILFQSGKLVAKFFARHLIDQQFTDIGSWYPTNLRSPNFALLNDDSEDACKKNLLKCMKGLLTLFIQNTLIKFTEKKLAQITGKDTYLSVRKIPLVTANDLAVTTVVCVESAVFSSNNTHRTTAELMAKTFVLNKMVAAEQSILKKYWHSGVKKYRTIATIDLWLHNHPNTITAPQFILSEYVIPPANSTVLTQLLKKIQGSKN